MKPWSRKNKNVFVENGFSKWLVMAQGLVQVILEQETKLEEEIKPVEALRVNNEQW